jgi:hypothetical protein
MNTDRKAHPYRLPASPFVSPARSLADIASGPVARLVGKRGMASGDIVAHWAEIVGAELAACCAPERIAWPRPAGGEDEDSETRQEGAVLHLRVEGPRAIEVQHRAEEIIARVNQMFGFAAIVRIRIQQGPLPRREKHGPGAPARPDQKPAVTADEGEGDSLAAALERLGAAVRARNNND